MKKKTKKAAKKPRPKTVTKTIMQWRVVNPTDGWLGTDMSKSEARGIVWRSGDPYRVARVTITYEVRR